VGWHFWFETLDYVIAFRVYVWQRQKAGDFLETPTRWSVIVAAVTGAALGSKLLYLLEDPFRTAQEWSDVQYLFRG